MNLSDRRLTLGVIAAGMLLGVVSLIYPFGRDQNYYAFLADAIRHGKVLYRDVPMMQMPLTAVVHLLALTMFGHSMTAIRGLDLLWTAATALLIYQFVRAGSGNARQAAIAGVAYAFFYYLHDFWYVGQVDGFMNLPIAGALALALRAGARKAQVMRRREGVIWLAVGMLTGIALLFKYTIGLVLPLVLLFLVFAPDKTNRVRNALLVMGGAAAVVAAFFLMLGLTGGLASFLNRQVAVALPYSRLETGGSFQLSRFWSAFANYPGHWLILMLALAGLLAAIAEMKRSSTSGSLRLMFVLGWLGAGLVSVLVQGKFFVYHYLPLLPALAVLAGWAGDYGLKKLMPAAQSRTQALAAAGALLFAVLITPYAQRYVELVQVIGQGNLAQHWSSGKYGSGDYAVAEQMALSEYLRKTTKSDEIVLSWGLDPMPSFPEWRETYFPHFLPLHVPDAQENRRYNGELFESLKAEPAAVIVVKHNDRLPWVRGDSRDSYEALIGYPDIRDFIADNYQLEARIGNFDVLRRSEPGKVCRFESGTREEVLRFVTSLDTNEYRSVLCAEESMLIASAQRARRFISYGSFVRELWLGKKALADYLPALSIWAAGCDAPFVRLEPFCYQSEGESYIAGDFRFTLLMESRDQQALVYLIEPRR